MPGGQEQHAAHQVGYPDQPVELVDVQSLEEGVQQIDAEHQGAGEQEEDAQRVHSGRLLAPPPPAVGDQCLAADHVAGRVDHLQQRGVAAGVEEEAAGEVDRGDLGGVAGAELGDGGTGREESPADEEGGRGGGVEPAQAADRYLVGTSMVAGLRVRCPDGEDAAAPRLPDSLSTTGQTPGDPGGERSCALGALLGLPYGPRPDRRAGLLPVKRRSGPSPRGTSGLTRRLPYDLRHAGISFWLYSGVDLAERDGHAGQSIEVLFRHYAKFLDGVREQANRLIEQSMEEWDRVSRGEAAR